MYYIYIIKCENETLYTGITTDYKRRFLEHKTGKKGAKFTRAFKVAAILSLWTTESRSDASKLESQIKKLDRTDKLLLIADNKNFKKYFQDILDISLYKRVRKINI